MYPETILPIAANIPHCGTEIPEAVRDQFDPWPGPLWREAAMVTGWYTDELFGIPGIAITQTPINRVVVDLDRCTDDNREQNAAYGLGVIYTHNTLGEPIRRDLSPDERQQLLDQYYHPWHLQLEANIAQQINRWGYCLLLDCQSYADEPTGHENDHEFPRPDVAIAGCDNTPQWLWDSCVALLSRRGYTVGLDFPYKGCTVPMHYSGDIRVPAIKLQVNRRLYLKPAPRDAYRLGNTPVKLAGFDSLRNDIWSVILSLTQEVSRRLEGSSIQKITEA